MARRPGKAGPIEKLVVWTLLLAACLMFWFAALRWISGE